MTKYERRAIYSVPCGSLTKGYAPPCTTTPSSSLRCEITKNATIKLTIRITSPVLRPSAQYHYPCLPLHHRTPVNTDSLPIHAKLANEPLPFLHFQGNLLGNPEHLFPSFFNFRFKKLMDAGLG